MGLVYKHILLKGDKGGESFSALLDNGSSESFIRKNLAKEIATISRLAVPKEFGMGKGTLLVKESTSVLDIEIDGFNLFWHFLVVPDLLEELIIGADFLQRWKIRLDPENEKIIIDEKALKLKLASASNPGSSPERDALLLGAKQKEG
jgi:predicted aspartyl protease